MVSILFCMLILRRNYFVDKNNSHSSGTQNLFCCSDIFSAQKTCDFVTFCDTSHRCAPNKIFQIINSRSKLRRLEKG